MTQNNHNYLQAYDTSIAALTETPDDLVLMHRAVLSLARAGALDFAWAEYGRYGLDSVTQHNFPHKDDIKLLEDIMALKGRLLKDMALRAAHTQSAPENTGDSTQFARRSVTAYARAFAATDGYYSGVNVAAMSLLGGRSQRTVASKANEVLALLPNEKADNKEDTYYIEATRAECMLLMGHKNKAGELLRDALMHDPLNYTAHATTFKQFCMIMNARGESAEWLEPFAPPSAVHFAGYIFSNKPGAAKYLDKAKQDDLYAEICDQIQRHDIGFGYGALAAGSDILIAEALLEEGAELHIILPVPVDQFISTSVIPFGADWDSRFNQCLNQATSLTICSNKNSQWPDKISAKYASQIAMGRTLMRANTLFTPARQLLIWDEGDKTSATATDAFTWNKAVLKIQSEHGQNTTKEQIIIPYLGNRVSGKSLPNSKFQQLVAMIYVELKSVRTAGRPHFSNALTTIKNYAKSPKPVLLIVTDTGVFIGYEQVEHAARCAQKILAQLSEQYPKNDIFISGHFSSMNDFQDTTEELVTTVQNMTAINLPGEFYVSEAFAAVLTLFSATKFGVEYAGIGKLDNLNTDMRLFHIS